MLIQVPKRRSTVWKAILRAKERQRLLDGLRYLHFPTGPDADHEPFLMHASRQFAEAAPQRVMEALWRWRLNPDREGIVIVDGFGIDPDLPPTPIDGRRSPMKMTTVSEQALSSIARMMGEPFSFATEREGALVTDLTPVKGKEKALTNEGSEGLAWHTEHAGSGYLLNPFQRVVDTLSFLHLRADPRGEAKTLVADIRDALPLLEPDVIATLRRPEFVFRPPLLVRASLPVERRECAHQAVLTGSDEHPFVNAALYGDLTQGESPEAEEALASLGKAMDAVQIPVPTVPGRLVILDNRRVMHARYPFHPSFDGNDRWLQRCMSTTSLEPFRAWQWHKSPRVLSPGRAV